MVEYLLGNWKWPTWGSRDRAILVDIRRISESDLVWLLTQIFNFETSGNGLRQGKISLGSPSPNLFCYVCSIEGDNILRANTTISEVLWKFMKNGVVPGAMVKRKLSKKPVFSLTATIQP